MLLKKPTFIFCFLLLSFNLSNAQIEVAHISAKGYNATGFGGFLNFSFPVSEVNYVTLEGGLQYFKDKNTQIVALVPALAGFRYTLDQSGSGWYVEPNAGYTFVATTDTDSQEGAAAGLTFGYLVDLGNIPFNFSARYEHIFGNPSANVFSIRIAHSISFRKRQED